MSNDKNQDGFIDMNDKEGDAMMDAFMEQMKKIAGEDGKLTKEKIGEAVNLSDEDM